MNNYILFVVRSFSKKLILSFLAAGFLMVGFAQQPFNQDDSLTQKFYSLSHHQLQWFSSAKGLKKAAAWVKILETSDNLGIYSDKAKMASINSSLLNKNALDGQYKESVDRQITGMVLGFIKELSEGNIKFDYDEINIPRDTLYINELLYAKFLETPAKLVARLDCKDAEYLALKNFLRDSIPTGDTLRSREVINAMNYRRYMAKNKVPEYLLVNIPETEAVYYRNSLPVMVMKTVVGRKKSPTPQIASYITSIVTFPEWNVPHSIAVTELLPKVQKNENYLEQNNFEIVDSKGNPVDDEDLNWSKYTERNFPYFFRQSTGSENSLGVLKFNIQNPFSIFLHSTSSPISFTKDVRFLSHGCIRLEKPLELADALLRGNIDLDELKSGKKNTEPTIIKLPEKVPVFIIYSTVKVTGNKVVFLRDVYDLVKKG